MKKIFAVLLLFVSVFAYGGDMMIITINPNTFNLRGLKINDPFGLIQASSSTELYYDVTESYVNRQVGIIGMAGYTPQYTNTKNYTIISMTQRGAISYYVYYFFNKMEDYIPRAKALETGGNRVIIQKDK